MDINKHNNQCLKLHVIMKLQNLKNLSKIVYFKYKINFIIELCCSIIQLKALMPLNVKLKIFEIIQII